MDPNPNTAQRWRQARAGKNDQGTAKARVPKPVDAAQTLQAPASSPRTSSPARTSRATPAPSSPRTPPMTGAPAGLTLADAPSTEGAIVLDVEAALLEITRVPAATIHRAAAFTWASRAIAGYRVCSTKAVIQEGLSYLYLGEHYREAALAHAAMGEAWQPLFQEIEQAMSEDRARAFASMRGRAPVATR